MSAGKATSRPELFVGAVQHRPEAWLGWTAINEDGPRVVAMVANMCDAEPFVRAVNQLPALVAALRRLLRADERPPSPEQATEAVAAMSEARAALAAAGEAE